MNTLFSNKNRGDLFWATTIFILAQILTVITIVQHPRAGLFGTPLWRGALVLISWAPFVYGLLNCKMINRLEKYASLQDEKKIQIQRQFLTNTIFCYTTIIFYLAFLFY
jgi:hypothetical protein